MKIFSVSKLALTLILSLTLTSCGSASKQTPEVNLVLDFTPNAVHTGIYSALSNNYDQSEGIELKVSVPASSSDSVKLLTSKKVDFAILDIHDLALAHEQGAEIVGVMALVQRPLASLITQPNVTNPRQLKDQQVGVTGLPSDRAVLRSIVSGAGGNPDKVKEITIGFNAVASILTNRVAGVTAFWNVEGVALQQRRKRINIFRVDEFGAPAYPELVIVTRESMLRENPARVRATLSTLTRGYNFTRAYPQSSIGDLVTQVPGLKQELMQAELRVIIPAFTAGAQKFGELNPRRLMQWGAWDVEFGILKRQPNLQQLFDDRFVPN